MLFRSYGCSSLTYNEYDNAYYLGNGDNPYLVLVEAKNKDITSCNINENSKFLHSYAFNGCSSLTSITIPDSVTSIGDHAFRDCSGLANVTIPDSITSIRDGAINSERDFRKTQQKIPNKIENSLQMIA